ncbi:MAG: DsrE family protein [Rhodobacteraceae bacterium]|nr:DsrE family protein [Paracoccaceae bacterium]
MLFKTLKTAALGLCLLASPLIAPALAEPVAKVAIHIDENDPKRMNLVLNNAENIEKYYAERGEEVEIAIVANGPGLHMFRADTSPVSARLATMSLEYPNMSFQGCMNTHSVMTKKAGGTAPEILDEIEMVPSGAVQLIQLQQQGWAYLRP